MSGLVIPNIECIESGENFGRFLAEPLEKGMGITLGNSLRRVLLGYLPGAAVTQVRIEGIQHEFSMISYAKEDVTEFLLNVKEMRLRPLSQKPCVLTLEVQGEGRVCAADIKPSAEIEISNPELCLVSLSSPDAKLYVEFDVELGVGYRVAESTDNMPVGTIPVDAIFTPIRKVDYIVEPTNVGQETSRERLYLEVWTDGTIAPTDAISNAAAILMEQLTPFVDYAKVSQMKVEERLIRLSIPDEKYNMPVEQLNLSVRTMNCLRRSSITTVGELIAKGPKELLNLRNFGQKSFVEIQDRLVAMGLSLSPQPEQPEDEAVEEEVAEEVAGQTQVETETEKPVEADEIEVEPGESAT